MSQLGANALLTASLKLLEMKLRSPDHVTSWWKHSPYLFTEIVGNAAMQTLTMLELVETLISPLDWNCWK
jgi:hypothetical protein